MKKISIFMTLTLTTLLFAGCAAQQTRMNYISADTAKTTALESAGLSGANITSITAELNERDGQEYYDVDFSANGQQYDYDVDALTGVVISYQGAPAVEASKANSVESDVATVDATPPAPQEQKPARNQSDSLIGEDKAKELALSQVPGATESDIWEFEVDYDDGRQEYEGKIYYDGMEYEFEIDGYSGAIRNWEVESIYD